MPGMHCQKYWSERVQAVLAGHCTVPHTPSRQLLPQAPLVPPHWPHAAAVPEAAAAGDGSGSGQLWVVLWWSQRADRGAGSVKVRQGGRRCSMHLAWVWVLVM
jgi:hypothetical protein